MGVQRTLGGDGSKAAEIEMLGYTCGGDSLVIHHHSIHVSGKPFSIKI